MTEPVTNGTRTGAVTIHVGRQLRRSGGKLSEWVVIDRTSTGGVSDLAPLYLQVRDHVSSAARRATVAHATPVLAPAAAAGVVAAPCHTETPVPIRAGVNAYQGGTRPRIPRAV